MAFDLGSGINANVAFAGSSRSDAPAIGRNTALLELELETDL